MPHHQPTTIAILGGNSVVGCGLGQLLQGVGYEIRLLEEPGAFRPQELLEGVDVQLLMPYLGKAFRETFVIAIGSTPETSRIPVLALSTVGKVTPPVGEKLSIVPWPCRIEEMVWRIEIALRVAAAEDKPGWACPTVPPAEEKAAP